MKKPRFLSATNYSSRNEAKKRVPQDHGQRSPKRRRVGNDESNLPIYATKYTAEEIAGQERRPKKKVAVLIGYSGSGYKGMQLFVVLQRVI